MSEPDYSDVYEVVMMKLGGMGFKISDDPGHTDIMEVLDKVRFVKNKEIDEIREAYLELWETVENGTVEEHFFKLREKARGILYEKTG